MSREYPTYPIPAVGIVVVHDQRVLLVQRGREPAYGRWTIPGGVIEVGETLHEAARREIREECGIEVETGRVLHVYEPIVRDGAGRVRFHYVIIDVLARYVSGEVQPADDALDARWVGVDELEALNVMSEAAQLIREVLR
jgi:ADP-ribose pyrophosphatase